MNTIHYPTITVQNLTLKLTEAIGRHLSSRVKRKGECRVSRVRQSAESLEKKKEERERTNACLTRLSASSFVLVKTMVCPPPPLVTIKSCLNKVS